MSLIIHLCLVSILRMNGAMPTLLYASMAGTGTTLISYLYFAVILGQFKRECKLDKGFISLSLQL